MIVKGILKNIDYGDSSENINGIEVLAEEIGDEYYILEVVHKEEEEKFLNIFYNIMREQLKVAYSLEEFKEIWGDGYFTVDKSQLEVKGKQ
ncbi:hypothetical protein AGR56_16425 [Clostridium sp. DMHC 10]|uniref:hypothetical protein n=1 Tax=Clostridium sp. DMHC 10 TaxID=747377 RepID=UPI00069ED8D4|nr:hypothetical protein [Clostridium sp. DMHC 10]KOF57801.1 hypothetical protein AGR56_16425 [Clostridium sp. DMHC 10]